MNARETRRGIGIESDMMIAIGSETGTRTEIRTKTRIGGIAAAESEVIKTKTRIIGNAVEMILVGAVTMKRMRVVPSDTRRAAMRQVHNL